MWLKHINWFVMLDFNLVCQYITIILEDPAVALTFLDGFAIGWLTRVSV